MIEIYSFEDKSYFQAQTGAAHEADGWRTRKHPGKVGICLYRV